MSRILIWSPNYAPELIGIAPLVTDAAEWLARRGHTVDVVTAFPNYPERRIREGYRGCIWRREQRNGVDIHRVWLRVRPGESVFDKALYEATFTGASTPHIISEARRVDVMVCVVPSLGAALAAAGFRRARLVRRLVLWWQDLVVEAARSVGGPKPFRWTVQHMRMIERLAAEASDRIIVCSPGFADYLARLGVEADRIAFVPNWVDTDWVVPSGASRNGSSTKFLYAGNLGYTQGFETIASALDLVPEIEVDLVGAGNAGELVRRLVDAQPRLTVHPPVPREDFPQLLASADVHLVLQRGVSAGVNLPSKIATYLASARPILASINGTTPAADLLRKSGGAIVVPPENPVALAEAMAQLSHDSRLRRDLAQRGRAYAENHLARTVVLPALEREIVGSA